MQEESSPQPGHSRLWPTSHSLAKTWIPGPLPVCQSRLTKQPLCELDRLDRAEQRDPQGLQNDVRELTESSQLAALPRWCPSRWGAPSLSALNAVSFAASSDLPAARGGETGLRAVDQNESNTHGECGAQIDCGAQIVAARMRLRGKKLETCQAAAQLSRAVERWCVFLALAWQ